MDFQMQKPPAKYIEHDPDEPTRYTSSKGVYWGWAVILPVIWLIHLTLGEINWRSVGLGALTSGIFVLAMIEYTGNKVPRWMRR